MRSLSAIRARAASVEPNVLKTGLAPAEMSGKIITNGRQMPSTSQTKAAVSHETAAKPHRIAAEHHAEGDHAAAHEPSTKARGHSDAAHKSSAEAHGKSSQHAKK